MYHEKGISTFIAQLESTTNNTSNYSSHREVSCLCSLWYFHFFYLQSPANEKHLTLNLALIIFTPNCTILFGMLQWHMIRWAWVRCGQAKIPMEWPVKLDMHFYIHIWPSQQNIPAYQVSDLKSQDISHRQFTWQLICWLHNKVQ